MGVKKIAACRWCKGAIGGRRRTFCSDACVHQWRLRSSASYLRECVFARDRGVCALCDIDTVAQRRLVMRLPFARRMRALRGLIEQGTVTRFRKTWWEADHIVPVVEGGDSNLENLRTLCIPCHRGVTVELRLRRKVRKLQAPNGPRARPAEEPCSGRRDPSL